jgi:hypothetical protein
VASGRQAVVEVMQTRAAEPATEAAAAVVEGNAAGDFWESNGGTIRGVRRDLID